MKDDESPMLRLFARLGLPTRNRNDHQLGCCCEPCMAQREDAFQEMRSRVQAGEKPETLGELLMLAKKKKGAH